MSVSCCKIVNATDNYMTLNIGAITSNFGKNEADILRERRGGFSTSIGIDYFHHNLFFLSSSIGYLKSAAGDLFYDENAGGGRFTTLSMNHFFANTLFRLKITSHKLETYVGLGPQFDILCSTSSSNSPNRYSETILKNGTIWCRLRPEIGANIYLNKFLFGVNICYPIALHKISNLRLNYCEFTLNIGFKL